MIISVYAWDYLDVRLLLTPPEGQRNQRFWDISQLSRAILLEPTLCRIGKNLSNLPWVVHPPLPLCRSGSLYGFSPTPLPSCRQA